MSERWNAEQRQAIETIIGNMIVSASAGSGKTAVMIERVKRLIIDKGIGVKHILMLSFNEAIAQEIKEKMARALIEEVKKGRDVDFLSQQIDDIGMSDITTMHSFCNSLIREYFDVVGVDPAYSIMDENESDVIINKAINEVFDDYFDSGDEDFLLLKDKLSSTGDDSLREIVTSIFKFTSSLLDGDRWLEQAIHDNYYVPIEETRAASYLKVALQKSLDIAQQAIGEAIETIDTTKYTEMIAIKEHIDTFIAKGDMPILGYRDFLRGEVELPRRNIRDAVVKANYYNARETYKHVVKLAKNIFGVPFEDMTTDHVKDRHVVDKLFEVLSRFKTIYNREKSEVNKLDFNDLEHYAVEILSHDDIAREVRERYAYVCVDEYQDINEVQNGIISRVSRGDNLFVVGDPKQSIYGFRFTEPKIFVDKMKYYLDSTEGTLVELAKNYRSSPLLLDNINVFFDDLMRRDISGMIKDVYKRLENGQDFVDRIDKPFEALLYESPKRGEKSVAPSETYRISRDEREDVAKDDARIEASYIASKIDMLRGKEIFDVKIGGYREVRFDDMVILASSRSAHIKRILEILENDYKYPIDSAYLKRQDEPVEVKILLDFLRTIDNPRQDIMLYSTMKAFFDFVDSEFVTIRRGSRKKFHEIVLDNDIRDESISAKVASFITKLNKFRLMASFMNVHDFLLHVIDETSYRSKLLMTDSGRMAVDNIDKFIVSLAGKKHASTVQEFLYAYDNYDIDNEISATSQSVGSCIHTSTIHQSKGLEYPIVFIVGIGEPFIGKHLPRSKFLMDKDYGFALKTFDEKNKWVYNSWLIEGIKMKKIASETEEKMRLLYVAMTRAKNCLYMVGNVSQNRAPIDVTHKFSDWLYGVAEKKHLLGDTVIFKDNTESAVTGAIGMDDAPRAFAYEDYDDSDIEHYREVFDYEYPYETATHLAQKYTVTAINHEEREQDEYVPELYETEKTSIGSIYHKFMEHVNYEANTIELIEAEMRRMVLEKILTEEDIASICIDDVYKCMNSDIINKARVSRHDREKKFMMHLPLSDVKSGASSEKVIIQGIADLVIYGDENILVDFKKSSLPAHMLRDTYKKQLDIYKFALEKSMGITIHRMCLYVIGRDEIIDMKD